jgi:FkbM family methyltransferase
MSDHPEILVPHVGWLRHEAGDDVALFLQQGWFEAREQAMAWLYLREGDTFIDCGAHVGLFSVLAGRAIGAGGRLISIEPEPHTASLLRENLRAGGIDRAVVVEAGIADRPGTMKLHRAGDGRSAYNALSVDPAATGVEVRVMTLDDLLDEQKVERADFLKLDVEGLELSVWQGAQRSIARSALPLVMIEFTEENLQRAGHSTLELAQAVTGSGYTLCRFDENTLRLTPATVDGPIGYDNLFAVRDVESANQRLATASPERRRIATEILRRAAGAKVAQEAESIQRRFAELEQLRDAAMARIDRMMIDIDQLRARAEHSEKAHEKTGDQLRQTQQWLQTTTERAVKVEQKLAISQAAEKRLTEQLEETRQLVAYLRQQLFAFVTSKYEQLSWKLGVRKKPDWVDAFIDQQTQAQPSPSPAPQAADTPK